MIYNTDQKQTFRMATLPDTPRRRIIDLPGDHCLSVINAINYGVINSKTECHFFENDRRKIPKIKSQLDELKLNYTLYESSVEDFKSDKVFDWVNLDLICCPKQEIIELISRLQFSHDAILTVWFTSFRNQSNVEESFRNWFAINNKHMHKYFFRNQDALRFRIEDIYKCAVAAIDSVIPHETHVRYSGEYIGNTNQKMRVVSFQLTSKKTNKGYVPFVQLPKRKRQLVSVSPIGFSDAMPLSELAQYVLSANTPGKKAAATRRINTMVESRYAECGGEKSKKMIRAGIMSYITKIANRNVATT